MSGRGQLSRCVRRGRFTQGTSPPTAPTVNEARASTSTVCAHASLGLAPQSRPSPVVSMTPRATTSVLPLSSRTELVHQATRLSGSVSSPRPGLVVSSTPRAPASVLQSVGTHPVLHPVGTRPQAPAPVPAAGPQRASASASASTTEPRPASATTPTLTSAPASAAVPCPTLRPLSRSSLWPVQEARFSRPPPTVTTTPLPGPASLPGTPNPRRRPPQGPRHHDPGHDDALTRARVSTTSARTSTSRGYSEHSLQPPKSFRGAAPATGTEGGMDGGIGCSAHLLGLRAQENSLTTVTVIVAPNRVDAPLAPRLLRPASTPQRSLLLGSAHTVSLASAVQAIPTSVSTRPSPLTSSSTPRAPPASGLAHARPRLAPEIGRAHL